MSLDWSPHLRQTLVNGVVPAAAVCISGTLLAYVAFKSVAQRRATARLNETFDTIAASLRSADFAVLKAAAEVPQLRRPRYQYVYMALELACAIAVLSLHAIGCMYWVQDAEWEIRGTMLWLYMVGVHLTSCATRMPLRAAKFFPTFAYAATAISNARTVMLVPYDESTRILTLVQMGAGIFALVVCICVPVTESEAPIFSFARRVTHTAPAGELRPLDAHASLLSRLTFAYLTGPLIRSYRKVLTAEDMPDLPPSMHAAADTAAFYFARGKLRWRLIKQFALPIVVHLSWAFLRTACVMMPVITLQKLLSYSTAREGPLHPPKHIGILLCVGIFFSLSADALCRAQVLMQGRNTSIRVRSVLFAEILRKALKRRGCRTGLSTDGQIINLVGVDISKVVEFIAMLHQPLVEQPLQIMLSTVYLVNLLGGAALIGICIMVLALPLQGFISKAALHVQERMLRATDARLDHLNEVLSTMKTVKLFAWELPFAKRLASVRRKELTLLRNCLALDVLYDFAFVGVPMLVTMATFGVHTLLLHRPLSAQSAFTALAIFNLLRTPLADMPEMVMRSIAAFVSLSRIESFLAEPETDKYVQLIGASGNIGMQHASFVYNRSESRRFALSDLSCTFPTGVSLVVGPVGAGKSSLLLALLGEMDRLTGTTYMPRPDRYASDSAGLNTSVAYCPQNPWILGTSVRNNILFGAPYDEPRYREVLHACALEPDLETFEFFDDTEVGEKGTTLSGGQKARVALARALYSHARYVFIDDVLSAVDANTARHLVEHAFCGRLARGRTFVLATHSVSLVLPVAEFAVVLEKGEIIAAANPEKLAKDGILYEAHTYNIDTQVTSRPLSSSRWQLAVSRRTSRIDRNAENSPARKSNVGQYLRYGAAVSSSPSVAVALWLLVVALYVSVRGSDVAASSWLRHWARSYDIGSTAARNATPYYLFVYAALVAMFVLATVARDTAQYGISLNISHTLYDKVVAALLYAKPQFYDKTPVGRIVNRLSKDMETIDQEITTSLQMLIEAIVNFVAILAIICWATPHFLVGLIFVCVIYWSVATLYMKTSRQVKRIDSAERSPLYTLVGEALAGTVTIRAFGASDLVISNSLALLDRASRPFLYLWTENRWLSVRVDITGAIITFSTAFLLVLSDADAALVGFTLSYAVLIVNIVLRIVRRFTLTEINMNAVERIGEYIDIEQECVGGIPPPAHWPTDHGNIVVSDLSVRYSPEFPRALDGVSFTVLPGEKVGIVGRTGSGKSTLSLAFFRFLEAETGSIEIDNVNIADVPLETLRRQLTIIPQDSQLFKGTVRSNLDPFDSVDDHDMYVALHQCKLDNTVKSLDDEVEQGGANFSAGQRQLLSLARGLLKLRNSRILILDESTANLDSESDAQIQHTIRNEVAPTVTILTVAHRLKTIIDYDKVLVLDRGHVLEFDRPAVLLANHASAFYSLCERSGELDKLQGSVKSLI